MCSYYSKGAADYVGVWDFDEFFQPMGKNKNLLDVLRAMGDPKGIIQNFHPKDADPDQIQLTWKGGRGVADGDGHPFCYLLLDTAVTQVSVPSKTAAQNVRPHLSTFSGYHIPSLAPYNAHMCTSPLHRSTWRNRGSVSDLLIRSSQQAILWATRSPSAPHEPFFREGCIWRAPAAFRLLGTGVKRGPTSVSRATALKPDIRSTQTVPSTPSI